MLNQILIIVFMINLCPFLTLGVRKGPSCIFRSNVPCILSVQINLLDIQGDLWLDPGRIYSARLESLLKRPSHWAGEKSKSQYSTCSLIYPPDCLLSTISPVIHELVLLRFRSWGKKNFKHPYTLILFNNRFPGLFLQKFRFLVFIHCLYFLLSSLMIIFFPLNLANPFICGCTMKLMECRESINCLYFRR